MCIYTVYIYLALFGIVHKSPSSSSLSDQMESPPNTPGMTSKGHHEVNHHFMKKLPKDAEASNILVGELEELVAPVSAFIRLNTAIDLGDLTEVPLPTRFIFILLGPNVSVKFYSFFSQHKVAMPTHT